MEKQEKAHPRCLKYLYQEGKVFLQKLQTFSQKLLRLLLSLKPFLEEQRVHK